MARLLAAFVHVVDEGGRQVTLAPGTAVPAWAKSQVTNPKAFADGDEPEAATAPAPTVPEPEPQSHVRLQATAKARGLSGVGSKAALIARLEADDREQVNAAAAAARKTAADVAATTAPIKE